LNTQLQLLESTTNLECQSKQNQKPDTLGPKSTSPANKGDYWEYHVCLEATLRNAEVFKNLFSNGKTDIILKINGQYVSIDVKAKKWDPESGIFRAANGDKIGEGVHGVAVDPSDKKVSWFLRPGVSKSSKRPDKYRCPPGLEDFWD
jgi:hypothetical protein